MWLLLLALLVPPAPTVAAQAPKRDWEPVELTGTVTDWWYNRNWRSYYWREDFTFMLKEDGTSKTWRIISREPTPNYDYRMGTTKGYDLRGNLIRTSDSLMWLKESQFNAWGELVGFT